jgi:starvation-inducible DNA-binding protein
MVQTIEKKSEALNEMTKVLNQQVANFNVLYMKLHHYHWYIEGAHFFTLHAKFEELYNETTLHMDEIAERLLTIGGKPVSTMKQCLNEATIAEASGGEDEQKMVEQVRKDLITITEELKDGMDTAEKHDDEATSDMLLSIKSSFEKHIWMLNAFLKK